MGISDRHILVPYLWIRPISSWVRFGVKNQKKVDDAVVFGLRGIRDSGWGPGPWEGAPTGRGWLFTGLGILVPGDFGI